MRSLWTSVLAAGAVLASCAPAEPGAAPGNSQEGREADGMRYRAETQILESHPVQLHTTATVTNTTNAQREVEFPDGCTVLIRAYPDAERAGEPAWDQQRAVACTMAIQIVRFEPGESREYRASATATEILGDSLPEGRYHFAALLRPDGQRVEVPAGEAELRR